MLSSVSMTSASQTLITSGVGTLHGWRQKFACNRKRVCEEGGGLGFTGKAHGCSSLRAKRGNREKPQPAHWRQKWWRTMQHRRVRALVAAAEPTAHPTPLDSVCTTAMQSASGATEWIDMTSSLFDCGASVCGAKTSSRRPHRKPMLPRLCETLASHLARTC